VPIPRNNLSIIRRKGVKRGRGRTARQQKKKRVQAEMALVQKL